MILETAELGSYDHVRYASMLAMEAGADFIKTSTGKAASRGDAGRLPGNARSDPGLRRTEWAASSASKPPAASRRARPLCTASVLVKETLGDEWLTPDRIRIGASSVLNDLLMQYAKTQNGRYGRAEDFSKE